jgi:hypothetical protein
MFFFCFWRDWSVAVPVGDLVMTKTCASCCRDLKCDWRLAAAVVEQVMTGTWHAAVDVWWNI